MRRSSRALNRRRSGWHAASFAALILTLGSGCKDDNGGKGPIDDDSGMDEGDAGEGDADVPKNDGSMDASPDGGDSQVDAETPDTGTPEDGGSDAGDAGDSGMGGNGFATTTSIEFGLSPCGGDAPTEGKTFALTNTGTTAINYTVTLSSTSAFSIQGETDGSKSGTIAPGTEASLTINAAAVPGAATAGQDITASLTVTSNLPAPLNSFQIPVKITPQGAHLTYGAGGAPTWLLVQTGQRAADKNVVLTNTGNAPAAITVTQPDVDAFGLQYNGALANQLTVPAAGSATLVATFEPNFNAPYSDEAPLAVAAPVCQGGPATSLNSVTLQGAATGEGLTLDITDPFEARVNCGAAPADLPKATIAVTNRSDFALDIGISTIAGPTATPFALSKSMLSLAAGGGTDSFDVTLLASEAPSSAVPGTEIWDTLLISPQSSSINPIIRRLSTTVQGAVLSVATPPAFANATYIAPATQQVNVTNTGNLAASPTLSIGGTDASLFAVTQNPAEIAVGSTPTAVGVTFTPPVGDIATKNATLIVTPRPGLDVICDPLPAPTALSGAASTSGFQPITSNTVNFTLDCPTAGATPGQLFGASNETVSFVNSGNANMKWTAAVDDPTKFVISIGGTPIGTEEHDLAMTAQADIQVDAVDIPFPATTVTDGYSGTLTITTDVPGDTPHDFKLARTAQGAVITATGLLGSFNEQNVKSETDAQTLFSLTNSGNVPVTVDINAAVTGTSGSAGYIIESDFATVSSPASLSVPLAADNTPVAVNGFFDPVYPPGDWMMNFDENLDLVTSTLQTTITAPGRLCDVLPTRIDITGTGTDAVSGVSVTAVDFSASPADRQTCGGIRAAKPKTIVVTNYGNQVLRIDSATLDDPTNFSVYVNSAGTTAADVPAWDDDNGTPGSAVVVVSPNRITDTSSGTHTATANLTIATSIGGTPTTGSQAIAPIPLSNSVVCP